MGELERTLTTKGLGLKMNPDGESYSLVSVGDCEETDIFVGFCEDGLPVTVIESGALDSARIESITLGECVHTVGEKAFYYCGELKSVKMTGVERIEWLAFDNCRALSEVDFGKKLTFIAERAFEGCRSLSAVNLPGTISEIGASAFSGLPLEVASIEGAEDNEYEPILWSGRLADMLSDRNARVIRRRKEGSEAVLEGAVVNTTGLSVYLSADGKSYIADGWGTMDFYTK